jgi:ankyrin repeat protein
MIVASYFGHEAVVRLLLLLEGKADVESKDSRWGQTPLSWAVGNGQEVMVKKLLLEGKADVESKYSDGWTSLSWAAENGKKAVVRLQESSY